MSWESVDETTSRLTVPGGWIYNRFSALTFVPYPSDCAEGHLMNRFVSVKDGSTIEECLLCHEWGVFEGERTGVEWVAHS